MDSSETCGIWRPCLLHTTHHHHQHRNTVVCPHAIPQHHHHHHHYHLHFSPHCPVHSYLLKPNGHPCACPNSLPLPNQSDLQVPQSGETYPSDSLMTQEVNEEGVGDEYEDEDDPVFVLTDEWKEFFAKSEAKRRLAKKQAKKKAKA